ncbi:PASTA domain-containing protein [Micromonospora sp. SL4-19]|uniref:PASTA domain-containing protein n=1 Tax=Micromonospora sp. SL4-19 TaxID=3399129 RepID=UPI003A4DD318
MSDDRQEPPAGDADATRPLSPDRPDDGDADATRAMSGLGDADAAARQRSAHQATHQLSGGDALPPAWSGRAGVPPPRPFGYSEAGTEWYVEEQSGRRWWMPIVLGILALVLIALIGLGVWLVLRAAERNPDPALPPSSASASTAPETSSASEATSAPTSSAPSTSPPTTTAVAGVPMPPLVGLPEPAARAALDRLNVDYRVQRRTSDQPAGTVIETDPAAGGRIAEGDRVTIVVAEAGAPTTGAGTPTPRPTATATP